MELQLLAVDGIAFSFKRDDMPGEDYIVYSTTLSIGIYRARAERVLKGVARQNTEIQSIEIEAMASRPSDVGAETVHLRVAVTADNCRDIAVHLVRELNKFSIPAEVRLLHDTMV